MSRVAGKCRRTSTEQSSPRGTAGRKKDIFASASPSSSSSQSPSPPRRRDVMKNMVLNVIRPRTVAVPNYRGVRYREELSKYVSEIRPTKCSKKIWLGTYDTPEEAARAFDIGNLCCQKNLPLNFPDSPTMLKRISSQLSPEEARSAIAKLAKEVARLEVSKREIEVEHAAMPHHEVVQPQAFQPEIAQIQRLASTEIPSNVYTEQIQENIECAMDFATPRPIGAGGGPGCRSWSFQSLSDVVLDDNLTDIPFLNFDTPSFDQDAHNYGDIIYYSHDYGF